jgi:hypothetical protein
MDVAEHASGGTDFRRLVAVGLFVQCLLVAVGIPARLLQEHDNAQLLTILTHQRWEIDPGRAAWLIFRGLVLLAAAGWAAIVLWRARDDVDPGPAGRAAVWSAWAANIAAIYISLPTQLHGQQFASRIALTVAGEVLALLVAVGLSRILWRSPFRRRRIQRTSQRPAFVTPEFSDDVLRRSRGREKDEV